MWEIWEIQPSQWNSKAIQLKGKGEANGTLNKKKRGLDGVTITCISPHPNQPVQVVTGSSDGSLAKWDLRQPKFPIGRYKGHSGHGLGFFGNYHSHFFPFSVEGAAPRFLSLICSELCKWWDYAVVGFATKRQSRWSTTNSSYCRAIQCWTEH